MRSTTIVILIQTSLLFGSGCAQDGPSPLKERTVLEITGAQLLLVADVNGDGRQDLLTATLAGLQIRLQSEAGRLEEVAGGVLRGPKDPSDLAVGDFNGDGRTDIVVSDHEKPRFWLYLQDTKGGFANAPGSPFTVDATPHLHTLAARDFNHDGHLDVVTDSWPESKLVLVPGNGDGTFRLPGTKLKVPEVPILNLRMADMNGDGYDDIVTPAHDRQAVSVLLGTEKGGFTAAPGSPFRSFGGFSHVAIADLDKDGKPDVAEVHRGDVTTEYKQDAVSMLLNDGTGRLRHAKGSPILLSGRANRIAVGDVNGDGWPDVATVSEHTKVVTLCTGSPSGFTHAGNHPLNDRPRDIVAGDLDGDGKTELLVVDRRGRIVWLSALELR